MVRVRVLDTIKFEGARHSPGSLIDIPPHLYRRASRVGRVEKVDEQVQPAASHSDLEIELRMALMDAIPGLQTKPAAALIAAGITSVEQLAGVDNAALAEIDGVAAGTIAKIREVVPAPDSDDDDDASDSGDEPVDEEDGDE